MSNLNIFYNSLYLFLTFSPTSIWLHFKISFTLQIIQIFANFRLNKIALGQYKETNVAAIPTKNEIIMKIKYYLSLMLAACLCCTCGS